MDHKRLHVYKLDCGGHMLAAFDYLSIYVWHCG